jgi:hypothetical protein
MKAAAVALAVIAVACGALAFATWGDGSPSPFLEISVGVALLGTVWSGFAVALQADRGAYLAFATNAVVLGLWVLGLTWLAVNAG